MSTVSSLDQLKAMTTVVADTGDLNSIAQYRPTDATTNPSLILAASHIAAYAPLIAAAIDHVKAAEEYKGRNEQERVEAAMDRLLVNFGVEILKVIPGRVSTEVDASLSFSTTKTIAKARELIALYAARGIPKTRVLIKIASTWEGIRAAEILEREHGIHCNLTLLFSFAQARACAEAGVTLISPFVGRILDYYKSKNPGAASGYIGASDPGVISVHEIYTYYKRYGYNTIVMGASFRNVGEIKALAGIDFLTISPSLLSELQAETGVNLPRILSPETVRGTDGVQPRPAALTEEEFRWAHNADAMAVEKLADGIRKFAEDGKKLKQVLKERLA